MRIKKSFFPIVILLIFSGFWHSHASDFCKKSKLPAGDGTQKAGGFCSDQILGEIPSTKKMVSALIISPENEATIPKNRKFIIEVITENLNTGFFTDPTKKYYSLPQKLGSNGAINGHNHITIQKLNDESKPLPADKTEFFLGLNDLAKKGIAQVTVETPGHHGLPPGRYRICTMTSSNAHQPVIMPVAKRGAQDDCIRITVK